MNITPNPFKDVFQVDLPSGLAIETIDLLDVSGKKYDVSLNPGPSFWMVRPGQDLPAGIYVVKIVLKNGVTGTKQVVKL